MSDDARIHAWLQLAGLIAVTAIALILSFMIAVPFLAPLTGAMTVA